jgi:hypothetical protein
MYHFSSVPKKTNSNGKETGATSTQNTVVPQQKRHSSALQYGYPFT